MLNCGPSRYKNGILPWQKKILSFCKVILSLLMILSITSCKRIKHEPIITDDMEMIIDILPIDLEDVVSIGFVVYDKHKDGYGYLYLTIEDVGVTSKIVDKIRETYVYKKPYDDFVNRRYDDISFGSNDVTLYLKSTNDEVYLTQGANGRLQICHSGISSIYYLRDYLYMYIYENILSSSNIPYDTIIDYEYGGSYRDYYTPIVYEDEQIRIEAVGRYDIEIVSDTIGDLKENIDTYGLAAYDGNSSVDINDIKAGSHKLTLKDKIGNEYYFYIEIDQ